MSGEDYSITFEGNVTNSLVINLCGENNDTASKRNHTKEGDIEGKKIYSPCDEDLKIKGDVSNSAIIHGVAEKGDIAKYVCKTRKEGDPCLKACCIYAPE